MGVRMQIPCFLMALAKWVALRSCRSCPVTAISLAILSQWRTFAQKSATGIALVNLAVMDSRVWMAIARKTSALAIMAQPQWDQIALQMANPNVIGAALATHLWATFVK